MGLAQRGGGATGPSIDLGRFDVSLRLGTHVAVCFYGAGVNH